MKASPCPFPHLGVRNRRERPRPAASGSGTPIAAGGFDPIFLVILVIALILILLGWWLFRGGGRRSEPTPPAPTPPTPSTPKPTPDEPAPEDRKPDEPAPGGPTPLGGPGGPVVGQPRDPEPPIPPPPQRNCVEGEEEWRNDKPASSFLIAAADARVRLATDPTTPELEAWMAQFGFPHGATAGAFAAVDDPELDALLAGLPAGPTTYHWVFEFQLDEYRLECQRKWRCENDIWVPTGETRLIEGGPTPYAGRFAVDGPARTRADVRAVWLQVRAALANSSTAEAAMDAYRKAC